MGRANFTIVASSITLMNDVSIVRFGWDLRNCFVWWARGVGENEGVSERQPRACAPVR